MGRLYTTPEGILTMFSLDCYDYVVSHYTDEQDQQRIRALLSQGEPTYRIMRSASDDHGRTWSEPVQTGELIFPPDKPIRELYTSRLLPLQDGSLLLFLWGRTSTTLGWGVGLSIIVFSLLLVWGGLGGRYVGGEYKDIEGRRYDRLPIPGYVQICIRSTDDGQSWSEPAYLDGRTGTAGTHWMLVKDKRTEISVARRDHRGNEKKGKKLCSSLCSPCSLWLITFRETPLCRVRPLATFLSLIPGGC